MVLHLTAAAVVDGAACSAAPGSLLLEVHPVIGRTGWVPDGCWRAETTVLAAGSPAEVAFHAAAATAVGASLPESILMPGLANAHAHLDLTHIGPRPFDPHTGFMGWIDVVRRARHTEPAAIAASVRRGVQLSLGGGVVAVGDIAGAALGTPRLEPWRALSESVLTGVSFLEFFAIGRGERRGIDWAGSALADATPRTIGRVRLGLQPHAPNTVSPDAYRWAVDRAAAEGLALATHLAETIEEREFVSSASGPQRRLLEALGLWDDRAAAAVGHGCTPIAHLRTELERARFVLAHVNDATDDDLALLTATGQSVVYCPRASDYFGNPARLGPHRYREMLDRGINVALGTDSIINLPPWTGAPGSESISVLDEMRLLAARDGTDPMQLLRMGTINGARALGLDERAYTFAQGSHLAGVVAVDGAHADRARRNPAESVMMLATAPRLLVVGA